MNERPLLQYFKENPDYHNPKLNTKLGVYSEGCGLDNVLMSWGHDDYMYLVSIYTLSPAAVCFEKRKMLTCACVFISSRQVAKENKCTLPSAGLFIIRYHSFYRKPPRSLILSSFCIYVYTERKFSEVTSQDTFISFMQPCTSMEPTCT